MSIDIDNIHFEDKTCQEASTMSNKFYIPCGKPAVALVKNRDPKPYYMCRMCADHNVNNRGAKIIGKIE